MNKFVRRVLNKLMERSFSFEGLTLASGTAAGGALATALGTRKPGAGDLGPEQSQLPPRSSQEAVRRAGGQRVTPGRPGPE